MTHIKQTYGNEKPIYYVFAEGGAAPSFPHTSRFNARKEAERLSRTMPGIKFHIVKVKESIVAIAEQDNGLSGEHFDRQSDLQRKFSVGQAVKVRDDHYAYARQRGRVTRLGNLDEGDTSIYAKVGGRGHEPIERRFSPSSLRVADESGKAQADQKSLLPEGIGGIIARALLGIAIDGLKPAPDHEAESFDDDSMGSEDSETINEACGRINKLEIGDEIIVIASPPLFGIVPGRALEGTYAGPTAEKRVVMVDFRNRPTDKSTTRQPVNVSRVFAADDPAVVEILMPA